MWTKRARVSAKCRVLRQLKNLFHFPIDVMNSTAQANQRVHSSLPHEVRVGRYDGPQLISYVYRDHVERCWNVQVCLYSSNAH